MKLIVCCIISALVVSHCLTATSAAVAARSPSVGLYAPDRYDGIPDMCLMPMDFGYCRAKVKRYYFDMRRMKCAMFYWGGCAGNVNNFKSMEDCNKVCLDGYDYEAEEEVTGGGGGGGGGSNQRKTYNSRNSVAAAAVGPPAQPATTAVPSYSRNGAGGGGSGSNGSVGVNTNAANKNNTNSGSNLNYNYNNNNNKNYKNLQISNKNDNVDYID